MTKYRPEDIALTMGAGADRLTFFGSGVVALTQTQRWFEPAFSHHGELVVRGGTETSRYLRELMDQGGSFPLVVQQLRGPKPVRCLLAGSLRRRWLPRWLEWIFYRTLRIEEAEIGGYCCDEGGEVAVRFNVVA